MSNELTNRVALVTGASSGIGEATALTLAAAGARVAIAARRRDRLEGVARCIEESGGEALVIEADFGIEADAQRAVRETEKAFGRLDILVNNAGVMYLEPVIEADLALAPHVRAQRARTHRGDAGGPPRHAPAARRTHRQHRLDRGPHRLA